MKAVGTPPPSVPPANPTTPLDVNRLKTILHGFGATVGADGVDIARTNVELIQGVRVNPAANIMTHVDFEPPNASGSDPAVMPDLSLVASEVDPVVSQETDEHPQLHFNHEFRHGDPYTLAAELHQAMDLMSLR